ncbi:esterase/lipase family protein [Coralloluteibacterium stylophorae]|uniref:Phospholipase n=1 Tax=Coralloluteibacterium stylophorae TaxID=1776034 RepID=A0A8J8AYV4_9GAMM|nr:phospholipase [Coralloluteibacterium stylophorae]MBS7457482.1 phospholipase [Coralloluteibacterium stylophorae]
MPPPERPLIVFVHGWGATSTRSYGGLPDAVLAQIRAGRIDADIAHLWLGRYVSFRDEVRMDDLARGFDAALAELLAEAGPGRRVACIAHSTGGVVVREWLARYYPTPADRARCALGHLVMLAPPNAGSALAQLGQSRLAGLRAWFGGVEPGRCLLDWLELGSDASYRLAHGWITGPHAAGDGPPFQFVLCGDAIDRRLYDHVNAYTGEIGSDGVVRLAAAHLDAHYLQLRQPPAADAASARTQRAVALQEQARHRSQGAAFRILPRVAHSGSAMGIMASVVPPGDDHPTVAALLRCLAVRDTVAYAELARAFAAENAVHQAPELRLEIQRVPVLRDREFIHDPHSMLVLRLFDDTGLPVEDVDVLLTGAGSPDRLPRGFMTDRQGNRLAPNVVTFYLNHAVLGGAPPVPRPDGSLARAAAAARRPYGLLVRPRAGGRFVEYRAASTAASFDLLDALAPNQTTWIDIVLHRVVRRGVFRLARPGAAPADFRRVAPGEAID